MWRVVIKCVPARFHQEEAHRWWAELSSSPLFKEISTAISKGKQTSGIAARLPKRPNIVVAIEIRGKAILVLNQTRTLTVAFEPGQELEGLQWLVEELEKDLETNTNLGENLENNEDLEEESEKDDEEQERHIDHLETQLRDQNLQVLRQHDECLLPALLASGDGCAIARLIGLQAPVLHLPQQSRRLLPLPALRASADG